jgi:uncharacterized protein YciI
MNPVSACFALILLASTFTAAAQVPATSAASIPTTAPDKSVLGYDAELAKKLGADDYGMKNYVLVVLKSGPKKMPAGKERDEMFKGHFANINRLAKEGKLAVAGPFDGVDGWRGLFILALDDIEEAKKHVATDPVIINGEMIAEFHKFYGSAAMMLVNETHQRIAKKSF